MEVNNKIHTASVDQYFGDFPNSDWSEILTHSRTTCLKSPHKSLARSNGRIENYNCCRKPGLLRFLRQNPNLTLLGLYHKVEPYHSRPLQEDLLFWIGLKFYMESSDMLSYVGLEFQVNQSSGRHRNTGQQRLYEFCYFLPFDLWTSLFILTTKKKGKKISELILPSDLIFLAYIALLKGNKYDPIIFRILNSDLLLLLLFSS